MSQKIDRLLEVLTEMMADYERGKPRSIRGVRARACEVVALRHSVAPQSVADIMRRQLAPHIDDVAEFDTLAVSWLEERDPALARALEAHAKNLDKEKVVSFFAGNQA